MDSNVSFRKYFENNLRGNLAKWGHNKGLYMFLDIVKRIFTVLSITIFFSAMTGILHLVGSGGFPIGIIIAFAAFFYLIMAVIIFSILGSQMKVGAFGTGLKSIEGRPISYVLLILTTVAFIVICHFIGTAYISGEMGIDVFLKVISGVVAVIVGIAVVGTIGIVLDKWYHSYRKMVLPLLLDYIDPGIFYQPEEYFPEKDFKNSGFYPGKEIVQYKGSDRIAGKSGETPFLFSFLDVQNRVVKRSGGRSDVKIEPLFKGIFFEGLFPLAQNATVLVMTDNMRSIFDGLIGDDIHNLTGHNQLSHFKASHQEFEKEFAVFGNDKKLAFEVLTKPLMDNLISLNKDLGLDFNLSIKEGRIHIAIPLTTPVFIPKIYGKTDNFEVIEQQCHLLKTLIGIPEMIRSKPNLL